MAGLKHKDFRMRVSNDNVIINYNSESYLFPKPEGMEERIIKAMDFPTPEGNTIIPDEAAQDG